MSCWKVEIGAELLIEIVKWNIQQRRELAAIHRRLQRGGPEAMGLVKSELEGVPPWELLSSP